MKLVSNMLHCDAKHSSEFTKNIPESEKDPCNSIPKLLTMTTYFERVMVLTLVPK